MVFVLLTSSLCHWVIIEQASFLCILAYDIFPYVLENIRSFFGASLNWLGSKLYPLPLSQRTSPPPLPVLRDPLLHLGWYCRNCRYAELKTGNLAHIDRILDCTSGKDWHFTGELRHSVQAVVLQNGVPGSTEWCRGGLGLGSSLSLSFPHLTWKYFSNVNSWHVLE